MDSLGSQRLFAALTRRKYKMDQLFVLSVRGMTEGLPRQYVKYEDRLTEYKASLLNKP